MYSVFTRRQRFPQQKPNMYHQSLRNAASSTGDYAQRDLLGCSKNGYLPGYPKSRWNPKKSYHRCPESDDLKVMFNACLAQGRFPGLWKVATLALITKSGKHDLESSFRPTCFTNEVGKLFERIIVSRIMT